MFCTIQEVKEAVNFPNIDAPIDDDSIQEFILQSEEEIEQIYHTNFGVVEDKGTADGDYATTTFSDSTKEWETDGYIGYVVWIYGGTGEGQYREITDNDAHKITVSPAFTITPDATSTYRITKLGYRDETVDGTGTNTQFVTRQPLINLNALTIDSTDVTTSYVHQYNDSGRLILGTDAEASYFSDRDRQLVNMKYTYGVYPMPRIIKRLCICIAGIRTLIAQTAGTYDDFTSVGLPAGFSASKGEPYMNIKAGIDYLQGEARGIVYGSQTTGQVSGDFRTGASYIPFTLFG